MLMLEPSWGCMDSCVWCLRELLLVLIYSVNYDFNRGENKC
jgi:hypothetical protein